MIRTGVAGEPENVLQDAKHVLFVEGESAESFDVVVLEALFSLPITIKPLGPSYSVKSVAQALHPHHPSYYFLIDRDPHHDDVFVERCWSNFPDPETHNLLIWRRRELENYFLDPHYLVKSRFCIASESELEKQLVALASRRLFLDAANWVLFGVRELQKRSWIEAFKDSDNLATAEVALDKLKSHPAFAARVSDVAQSVAPTELERLFLATLQEMTGGERELVAGRGNWIGMIQGKKVFRQLANSACFEVRTKAGVALQGAEKAHQIVKGLLRQDTATQPPDFVALRDLIQKRVQSG